MGLLRIIPVVILAIQLQGLVSAGSLPQLRNNRLAEGADRELPGAHVIDCGRTSVNTGKVSKTRSISSTLSSYFTKYAFTSGPIGSQNPPFPNNMGSFSFAEVNGKRYVYALQADASGETGYWLPQGGHIDIPRHPSGNQPKYVFTPDFSGCSWTVTPLSNGNLRIRHVEGGREAAQFNNLSEAQKGGSTSYAMQYMDYGYMLLPTSLVSNIPAFAYMHYSGGRWNLIVQKKTCATTTGGYIFQKNLLKSTTNVDSNSSYKPVSETKTYSIP